MLPKQHQITMKKLYADQFPPLAKGVRGIRKNWIKNQIPNNIPLAKERGINKD
jgi:hypothetical protein